MFTQITQAVTTALYDAFTKNRPQSVSSCRRKRRMVGSATSEAPDASVKSEVSEKTISITYNVPGRILFFLLLFLPFLPVGAQQMTGKDTCYVFRFKPGNDTFYVPYKENENELERLSAMLKEYALPLQSGKLYIGVSSYAASAPSSTSSSRKLSARRIAYLRCSRVKSELIVRHGITEQMFVTDRLLPHPYRDSLRNVVVVTFPAGIAKVKELAGEAAARRVSAYIKETTAEPAPVALTVPVASNVASDLQSDAPKYQDFQSASSDSLPSAASASAAFVSVASDLQSDALEYQDFQSAFSLRLNLLRWATLTPDLGVEWRINRHIGILVGGSWTSWSRDNKNRRYALWKVSPELRYYIGKQKRGFLGAMYHTGEFNYKPGDTGKQGDYQGGGITGGYTLPLNRSLWLDFHAAAGYTRAEYDKYTVTDGVRVRQGGADKNYWGINQAGVTLVWKFNQ